MTNRTIDQFSALLQRQEQEREARARDLLEVERDAARTLVADLRPDAGTALVEALDAVESHLREDKKADRLLARMGTNLPTWVDSSLPLGPDPDDPDRPRMIVFVPRPFADNSTERVAVAVARVDVSDLVFGNRSRARRRADQIAVETAERARDDALLRRNAAAGARR